MKALKLIGSFLKTVTGGENGLVSLGKAHVDSMSSKRVFKLFGGGSLITFGLTVIQSIDWEDPEPIIKWKAIIGLTLCAAGVFTGWAMKSPDKHHSSNEK